MWRVAGFAVFSRTLLSGCNVDPDRIVVSEQKDAVAPFLPSRGQQQKFIWCADEQSKPSVLVVVFGAGLCDIGNSDSRPMQCDSIGATV
jgi:hypothetical protein